MLSYIGPSAAWLLLSAAPLMSAHAFADTGNHNYFIFPPLIDSIPVFAVGDAVNVSWSTSFADRNINVWCAPGISLVQSLSNLPSNGSQLLPVLSSWKDPCHLQFLAKNASGATLRDFNSGAFNIDAKSAATPRTWAANPTAPGLVASETGGAAVATPTNTVPVSSGASSSGDGDDVDDGSKHCGTDYRASGLGFGAGIGVGFGISVAIAILTGIVAFFWLRRSRMQDHRMTHIDEHQELRSITDVVDPAVAATAEPAQSPRPYVVAKSFWETRPHEMPSEPLPTELPAETRRSLSNGSKSETGA